MKKTSMLAVFMLLGGAANATAQADDKDGKQACDRHPGPGHHFAELDKNSDGKVTREELLAHSEARFNEADANKDGRVTRDEQQVQRAKRKTAHFTKKDTNGDGKLSRQELQHMPDEVFARHDSNGDKFLSPDELQAFELRTHHNFHDAEEDEDDGLTRDVMREHSARRFGKLDRNGDGAITQDEMGRKHHLRHGA